MKFNGNWIARLIKLIVECTILLWYVLFHFILFYLLCFVYFVLGFCCFVFGDFFLRDFNAQWIAHDKTTQHSTIQYKCSEVFRYVVISTRKAVTSKQKMYEVIIVFFFPSPSLGKYKNTRYNKYLFLQGKQLLWTKYTWNNKWSNDYISLTFTGHPPVSQWEPLHICYSQ